MEKSLAHQDDAVIQKHQGQIGRLVACIVPSYLRREAMCVANLALLEAQRTRPASSDLWSCSYLDVRRAVLDWVAVTIDWRKPSRKKGARSVPAIEMPGGEVLLNAADQAPSPEDLAASAEIQEIVCEFSNSRNPKDAALLTTDVARLRRDEDLRRRSELVEQVAALISYGEDR